MDYYLHKFKKDYTYVFNINKGGEVGFSFGFEVGIGGMVETLSETVSATWDYISDGWNDFRD